MRVKSQMTCLKSKRCASRIRDPFGRLRPEPQPLLLPFGAGHQAQDSGHRTFEAGTFEKRCRLELDPVYWTLRNVFHVLDPERTHPSLRSNRYSSLFPWQMTTHRKTLHCLKSLARILSTHSRILCKTQQEHRSAETLSPATPAERHVPLFWQPPLNVGVGVGQVRLPPLEYTRPLISPKDVKQDDRLKMSTRTQHKTMDDCFPRRPSLHRTHLGVQVFVRRLHVVPVEPTRGLQLLGGHLVPTRIHLPS